MNARFIVVVIIIVVKTIHDVREQKIISLRILMKPYVVFTARRYASAVYAVVVCPPVCPSVRHTPALYKTANVKSRKQRRTIVQGLY